MTKLQFENSSVRFIFLLNNSTSWCPKVSQEVHIEEFASEVMQLSMTL